MTTRSGSTADLRVGLRVLTGAGFTKKGEIKFIGTTQFASGEWIGVLLDQPEGKNDGTVNDVKYFQADTDCGLFVRRVQVKLDEEVKSASVSTRERLNLLREKKSSMLRDAGAGSGIPSLKPTSSSSNLSSTSASVNSTGSGGSQATPAVRSTRRSSLAPPSSRTSPPPPPASVAPKKSRLAAPSAAAARPVPQTPMAPARAAQSFTTPTATPAPAPPAATEEAQSEGNTPTEEAGEVEEEQQEDVEEDVEEEQEEDVQEYVEEVEEGEEEVSAADAAVGKQQPCESPSPSVESAPVLEEDVQPEQSDHSPAHTVEEAPAVLQAGTSTSSQETAHPAEADKAVEEPKPIAATPVKVSSNPAPPQPDTATPATPAPAASEPVPAVKSTPAAATSPSVPTTPLPAPKNPTLSTPAAGTGHYATPLRDASARRIPPSRTPGASGDPAAATPSKDAALIQFMQTSIYKLTKEKDELAEKVAQLTGEVQDLNTHLGQSNDLTTSVQDDMERVVAEREELQVQLAAVQAQMAATQARSELEATTLRDRIKKLENTPPPKDPRVGELERQLADLNSMVESLTLDKEQLAEEQELLDEKYLQAQIDLEEALAEVQTLTSLNEAQAAAAAAHGGARSGGAATDEGGALALASLKAENEKLREALRRLNSSSVQDKQTLATQTPRLAALEIEVAELKTYKAQAEGDLAALRATVDSVASFEEMIETLSDRNMELAEQLAEAKEAVRDLEDSVELTEEIDQQQRKQIEADRSTIDVLTVSLSSFEQRLTDKDRVLAEQATAASRIKAANQTLKAEVQRLHALLSSGSQESKQLEAKLRELAYLRANQDVLTAELHAVQQAHLAASSHKHKFQALFTRVDAIFGGTAVFIEESKQINTEIAFVSAAATGLEACRGLSAVMDVVLQARASEGGDTVTVALDWDILPTLDSAGPSAARVVPTLGKLYALLLQAQAYSVQCNLDLFRPASSGAGASRSSAAAPRTVQRLIDLKARFEAVAQVSSRLKSVCMAIAQEWRTHTASNATSRAVMEAGNEGEADLSVLAEQEEVVGFLPSEGSTQGLCQLLHEVAVMVTDLTNLMDPSLESADALNVLQNCTLLSSCAEVNPSLQVELLLTSINALSDVALQQADALGSAEDDAVVAALRSMKIDVKAAVLNLKSHFAHYASQLAELAGHYQMLVSCFADAPQVGLLLDADAESTAQRVGLVQNFLRKLNSAPGLSSSVSSTQQLMLGTSGVMRFLPLTLLTNTVSLADTALCGRMREQHEHYVERYWLLTTQTHSDLLLACTTTTSAAGSSTYTEVAWRARVAESRSLILAKFESVGAHNAESEGAELSPDVKADSPVKAPAAQAKVQALLTELDIKKDELRVAMQRCDELQTQLDAATAAGEGTKKAGSRSHKPGSSKSASELQEEIATLEEALFATEEKVEALEAEGKALKAQLTAAGPRAESGPRDGDQPGAISFDFKASGLVRKKAGHQAGGVPTAQFQAVLDQSLYWKQLALRRITESLMPLAPLPMPATAASVPVITSADDHAQPKSASQLPVGLTFKHVELVASGLCGGFAAHQGGGAAVSAAPVCAADYAAIYHKLRLARASGTRIRSIRAESEAKGAAAHPAGSARSARRSRPSLLYRINL